jgi:hypothetical protein
MPAQGWWERASRSYRLQVTRRHRGPPIPFQSTQSAAKPGPLANCRRSAPRMSPDRGPLRAEGALADRLGANPAVPRRLLLNEV